MTGLILAIDPGPTTCGVVLYDADAKRVLVTWPALPMGVVIDRLFGKLPPFGSDAVLVARGLGGRPALVAIERVQSSGISGASLLQTSEVVGRLQQAAIIGGYTVRLVYRREVCSALHISGKSKDAQVKQRMLEMHPGGKGTNKEPGPLYRVASHAWQALGLAVAVTLLPQE